MKARRIHVSFLKFHKANIRFLNLYHDNVCSNDRSNNLAINVNIIIWISGDNFIKR
jgi:hypothetical protein